ncbi:hypothetical protein THAOC_22805 [Thalassiosira oceanica]|uniref:Uncharacterized protein n=1 Tax=Thalassiosira oceanica TaxID=159749 RepID=K0S8K4_THAOC|nr:hypothetical protein THAOC_22805 [Thalassiosira oceanica]|eukprot:EJK57181.1 hypothetical protein THAOC_22805 [Thalassiosira oceanica]
MSFEQNVGSPRGRQAVDGEYSQRPGNADRGPSNDEPSPRTSMGGHAVDPQNLCCGSSDLFGASFIARGRHSSLEAGGVSHAVGESRGIARDGRRLQQKSLDTARGLLPRLALADALPAVGSPPPLGPCRSQDERFPSRTESDVGLAPHPSRRRVTTAGQADESESEWAEPIADDAPGSLPFSLEVSALRVDRERDSSSSVHSRRPPHPPSIKGDCGARGEDRGKRQIGGRGGSWWLCDAEAKGLRKKIKRAVQFDQEINEIEI